MISSLVLAVAMAFQTTGVQTGYATWYGDTTPGGPKGCHGGYRNTCSPYVPLSEGGRGGELVWYAAVPGFKFRDKPYKVEVCRHKYPKRCVIVTVRDCLCSKKTKNVIDLSPAAFMRLSTLGTGRVLVTVRRIPDVRYGGR
jgi:hypothetical protein